MARTRIDLQPARNITGNYVQPGNEAATVGNMRQGVVYLNTFKVQASGAGVVIETATDRNLGDGTGNNFWVTVATLSPTAAGVLKATITDLGEVIRFRTTGIASEFSFSLVAFLSDQ